MTLVGSSVSPPPVAAPNGRDPYFDAISRLALLFAARHRQDGRERTVRRLYTFNSAPLAGSDARMLDGVDGRDALLRQAGLQRWPANGAYRLGSEAAGWLYWRSYGVDRHALSCGTRKLYLTPKLEVLGPVLRQVAQVGREHGVSVFKFGADYRNLRRPDRVVLYLPDEGAARVLAERLATSLAGFPGDDLPFAERLGSFMWTGVDPPAQPDGGRGRGSSWRQWVCRRLAESLHAAGASSPGEAVVRAEREMLARGIDPGRWHVADDYFEPGGD